MADSAASRHMSFRRDWFKTFKNIGEEIVVQIGENSNVKVGDIGSSEVLALVNGE